MRLQDIISNRAKIYGDMRGILDTADTESRELSAEESQRYDALEADFTRLTGEKERAERAEARERELRGAYIPEAASGEPRSAAANTEEEYRSAFGAWLRRGDNRLTADQNRVMQTRALGEASGSTGGYLVPQGFYGQIVETMKTFGTLLNVATVIHTPLGNSLPMPTMDDTGNEGAIIAENGSISEQDAAFGQKTLGAFKFTSKIIRVSHELLNDGAGVTLPADLQGDSAASGIEGIVNHIAGERLGRIMDHKYTVGAGTTEPQGIVGAVSAGVTGAAGQTTSVIYDNVIDLIYSIDKAYRGAAGFMANDLTIAALRKLKDTQGHPLWQPSLQVGTPDTLLGYAVLTNNYVPAMGVSAKSILFGDFRRYYIRIVNQTIAQRLTERYADFGQVGFLILMRADGNLMDASAVKAYVNSAT